MNLRAAVRAVARHSMRAYYLPLVAGLVLSAVAFLPWIEVGPSRLGGVPGLAGLWVLGLGLLASTLATLSVITRKNSRHPLLLVGLSSLAVLALSALITGRSAEEHAWAAAEARAIVDGVPAPAPAVARATAGLYTGLAAAAVIVLFGLTIVVRRVAQPFAVDENDDV
jgi:hypothetical protein